jgi:2-polyprenyl-3-methyl-5-hydroxy-6-metoxy-1,4-benzoquinol methylase
VTVGLLFAGGARPLDYGRRLSRLRWRRAFPQAAAREAADALPAAAALAGAEAWIAVRDETALPLPGARVAPLAGRVALAASRGSFDPAAPHTLRELENAVFRPDPGADSGPAPAIAFRTDDFPPAAGEPLGAFLARLAAPPTPREVAPEFAVFAFDDPFERERPEVTRHVPLSARRLLDVGCGAGAASAAAKRERPGLAVVGIERDPGAAARARALLDRVHEGDALAALSRLAEAGERFDAFVFADVLEHLEDPAAALALARRLAAPRACLVASVPNVGHVSLVRDLALGRFDPVPAGLADAGHLRWFTRRSLAEALEEAGWSVVTIEAEAGAPARDAQAFLARFEDWPGLDRESLLTYQWIAVARLDGAPAGTVDNAHGTA